jgi:hypothetical protein
MKKTVIKTEVYSRVSGYFRPVNQWNEGKKSEFNDRKKVKCKYKELIDNSFSVFTF